MTVAAPSPVTNHRFGPFGGRYVPETLIPALDELEAAFEVARHDDAFQAELDHLLREYVGRPTALSFAPRLSERVGAPVWLKREDFSWAAFANGPLQPHIGRHDHRPTGPA